MSTGYKNLPVSAGGNAFGTVTTPSGSAVATAPSDALALTSSDASVTISAAGKTVNLQAASGGGPAFGVIQVPEGTNPTATIPADILSVKSSNHSVRQVGNDIDDSLDFTTQFLGVVQFSAADGSPPTGAPFSGGGYTVVDGDIVMFPNVSSSQPLYRATVVAGNVTAWTALVTREGDCFVINRGNSSDWTGTARWGAAVFKKTAENGWTPGFSLGSARFSYSGGLVLGLGGNPMTIDDAESLHFKSGWQTWQDGGNATNFAFDIEGEHMITVGTGSVTFLGIPFAPITGAMVLLKAILTASRTDTSVGTDVWTAEINYHLFWDGSAFTIKKTTVVDEYKPAGASTWTIACGSTGGLTCTGGSGTTIAWGCKRSWSTQGSMS